MRLQKIEWKSARRYAAQTRTDGAYKIPYQHNTVQNNTKTLKASEDD